MHRAATAILEDLAAFPLAQLAAGFRAARPLMPLLVMIVIMTPALTPSPTATADNRPIAAAPGAAPDCQCRDGSDVPERGDERDD
jgi:hypothetical protein